MAKATKSTKAAVLEDTEEVEVEGSVKQVINTAITRVLESTSVTGQHNRYKAMRAIAYQAFSNAIDEGTFDDLVDEAIANVDALPAGWEVERVAKVEAKAPAKKSAKPAAEKAPVKKASTKAASATKTARRRPTR
jgi:hypothetical protein